MQCGLTIKFYSNNDMEVRKIDDFLVLEEV